MEQPLSPNAQTPPTLKIIERGILTSLDILAELDIVDWQRGGIYWDNPLQAFEAISRILVNRAEYMIRDSR